MLMPLPPHNFPAYNKQASMSRILSFLCIPYSIQIAEITKYHLSLRKKGGNSMEEVHPFSCIFDLAYVLCTASGLIQ